jgi:methionyl-tRNA formyltransferase
MDLRARAQTLPPRGLDLMAGGTIGAWAVRNALPEFVRQVVCLDEELIAIAAECGHEVFAGDPQDPAFAPAAAALSVGFPLVLRPHLIEHYDGAIWNVHPGLLPYGRGMFPDFWALWEGTPAGATLHELTAGLQRGAIVEQREVAVLAADTGGCLRERVEGAARELVLRWLPRLADGARPPASVQRTDIGTYHSLAEFEFLRDEGRYEVPRTERERLARCLTFAPAPVPAA